MLILEILQLTINESGQYVNGDDIYPISPDIEYSTGSTSEPNANIHSNVTLGALVQVKHDSTIHSNVTIGSGSKISAYAVIEQNVRIGNGCIINKSTVVPAETKILNGVAY